MNNQLILKHLVDCGLAFGISFFSIIAATGRVTGEDALIALIPSALIALIKFRDFWNTQLKPDCPTPTIFL